MLAIYGIALTGCQFDAFIPEYTKSEPRKDDVVGLYRIDPDTVNSFKARHGVDPTLALLNFKSDGSFELKDMPMCWHEYTCNGELQGASGTWRIRKHQEWWAVEMETRKLNGRKFGLWSEAMLRDQRAPYRIHFIIGDPDTGEALVLKKSETGRSN